ncbi:MAG: riboflavin synthase [Acidimicrobiaceae bacterium]|nr:riboflavin synthase [Acidimicrobiaceae bacterium]MBO0747389.1 riboflavin synthase [Acidimicrobiaceae bacterium]
MFTGLVEETGRLRSLERSGEATRIAFDASVVVDGAGVGDSIAVNGCCLTVVALGEGWWAADAVDETLSRTNLGGLRPGDPVNLERPVRLEDHLGGHLVQGHVDGVGTVVSPPPDLRVRVPAALLRYLVPKGSVAVDGVSLTVVEVFDDGFGVALIPHTIAATNFAHRKAGDPVNIEVDVVAKYVERLLAAGAGSPYQVLGASS